MPGSLPIDSHPWPVRRDHALVDATMRQTIGLVTRRFQRGQREVFIDYPEAEEARRRAVTDKREAIRNLEPLLEQFSRAVVSHGGHVHRARTASDAVTMIRDIALKAEARRIVKTKSMATEEIELNQGLIDAGFRVIETDLGEYIIQRAGEKPSHILAPAAHKNRQDVQRLFQQDALDAALVPAASDEAQDLTEYARRRLRDEFLSADMGITGGNFFVAETGSVVLITNEGNADLVTSLPRILVSLVGVEKVMADWGALADIIQQPAMNGIGQRLSSYTTIISGVSPPERAEGPESWHVVLLDNGRTALRDTPYEDVLSCIRCGACLNACPVFRQIGGHAYGSVYSGPIGIVETPLLTDLAVGSELPMVACTVCHACADACPMDIDLPGHILSLRQEKIQRGPTPAMTRHTYRWWARLWSTPGGYRRSLRMARLGQPFYRRRGLLHGAPGLARGWFQTRNMPPIAQETFHEWWARTRGGPDDVRS